MPSRRPRRLAGLLLGLLAALCLAAGALPAAGGYWTPAEACPPVPSDCIERTIRMAALLDQRVEGGSFGFVLLGTEGSVLASWRAGESFYPASSIKVLYLLEALRWAGTREDAAAALRSSVRVDGDGCGGGRTWLEPLEEALRAMMQQSDNLRANAVGDRFGLEAINRTAAALSGVSAESAVAHRFDCGGPANDPPNRMTAADLAGVYQRYGAGTLLDPAAADRFASFFLDAGTGILDAVVAEESAAWGGADSAAWFRSRVDLIYKAGWWGTSLSVGGYVGLPRRVGASVAERGLAFALFVSEAEAVAPGFDLAGMVGELLREEIRAALATFGPPLHLRWPGWGPYPI